MSSVSRLTQAAQAICIIYMQTDRFTIKSQEALQEANRIAHSFSHQEVDGEHLLLAMIGQADSLELGSVVYRLQQFFDTSYPVRDLDQMLSKAGVDLTPAMCVDNKALDALLNEAEEDERIPRTVRDFLRVRVAAKAVKIPQKPRISATQKKKS